MSVRPNRKYKNDEPVVRELARMNYFERIGRNPYNSSLSKPEPPKHWNTLHNRDKVRDFFGNRINNKPPF